MGTYIPLKLHEDKVWILTDKEDLQQSFSMLQKRNRLIPKESWEFSSCFILEKMKSWLLT